MRRLCIVLCFAATLAWRAEAAGPKPINRPALIAALKIGGLSTRELVRKLKDRGVSFEVTPAVEDELRRAGASSEVIEAARANHRGGVQPASGVKPANVPQPPAHIPPETSLIER